MMASTTQIRSIDSNLPHQTGIASKGSSLVLRQSSSLHKLAISKLRPLPFQYVWALWHDKSGSSWSAASSNAPSSTPTSPASTYDDRLTLLADQVPDIATFYRIWNNFPWELVRQKDCVHVFRQGVRPLWEDEENLDGGCWVLKIRKDEGKAIRAWEEVCLMGCGGELQANLAEEHDHVLGMSYSPRAYWSHIMIWNRQGNNARSIQRLQGTVLERLSPELRPPSESDYYYKRHRDHGGWEEAVKEVRILKQP